jgi:hypothetical protein
MWCCSRPWMWPRHFLVSRNVLWHRCAAVCVLRTGCTVVNAITLGNSIQAFFSERAARRGDDPAAAGRGTVFFRLMAVLPAIVVAAVVKELAVITSFTGLAGFSIAFIIPALLAMRSEQMVVDRGVPCADTQYNVFRESDWAKRVPSRDAFWADRLGFSVNVVLLKLSALLSNITVKWASIAVGVALSIYVFYSLLIHGVAT